MSRCSERAVNVKVAYFRTNETAVMIYVGYIFTASSMKIYIM